MPLFTLWLPLPTIVAFLVSAAVLRERYRQAPRIGLLDHPDARCKVQRDSLPTISGIADSTLRTQDVT